MPDAPARPCLHTGCGEYAVRNGRCSEHASDPEKARGKTKERGYDGLWRNFRAWFLRKHPLCIGTKVGKSWMIFVESDLWRDCGRPAKQVHHIQKIIDSPELRLVESNCMPQCDDCHAIRSSRGE